MKKLLMHLNKFLTGVTELNPKKTFLYLTILMFTFMCFYFSVQVSSGDPYKDITGWHIGEEIQAFVTGTVMSAIKSAYTTPDLTAAVKNIAIGLFLVDFSYAIGTQYLSGSYKDMIPTVALKGFFIICLTTALSDGSGGKPYIFSIIEDLVSIAAGSNAGGMGSWFTPKNNSVLTEFVNNFGLLKQWDTAVNKISDQFLAMDGFFSNGIFLIWAAVMYVCIRIYLEFIKMFLGLLIKSVEWAIGLPFAFLMLAGKGHPQGDEYFNTGMKYIYYVALDVMCLWATFNFGSTIFGTTLTAFTNAPAGVGAVKPLLSLLVCIVLWFLMIKMVDQLVSGIAGGAPAIPSNQGASVLSVGRALGGSTTKVFGAAGKIGTAIAVGGYKGAKNTLDSMKGGIDYKSKLNKRTSNGTVKDYLKTKVINTGISAKNMKISAGNVGKTLKAGLTNADKFFKPALKGGMSGLVNSTINSVIGRTVEKDGVKKRVGGFGQDFLKSWSQDISAGFKVVEDTKKVINKQTGLEESIKVKKIEYAKSAGFQQVFGDLEKTLKEDRSAKNQINKFQNKYGVSLKDIKQLGITDRDSQLLYIENYSKFQNIEKELKKYGGSITQPNNKGVPKLKGYDVLNQELASFENESKNSYNSFSQRNFSKQSDLTKHYQKGLETSKNVSHKIEMLSNWIEEGAKDPEQFSSNEYKNAVKNLKKEISASGNTNALKSLQKKLAVKSNDLLLKANNNELFEKIEDVANKERSNQVFKSELLSLNDILQKP